MKVFKRMLSLALALVLACGVLSGVQLPKAAAVQTQSLAQLLETGAIKPLGRTVATANGILTVWSGCGFEMNVYAPADTTLTVGYTSSHSSYWAVLVDGEQVWRGLAASGTGTFSATIPYGTHTVSVVKETQIDWTASVSHVLTTMAFGGELLAAPENKDLYIEFVGDSYSAGDGALGEFVPGVAWSMVDDSATHGFPWYTAKALNADYSIVARGGIGLFDGTSAQEGIKQTTTMTDIYAYTSGFNKTNGEYSFARQPDIVVVELGANDGISTTDATKTIANWQAKMATFLTLVREKNPDAAIVCIQHDASKYQVLQTLVQSGDYGEAYAYYYAHNGNGSAALNYQKEGHPSAEDHQEWAKNLVNFLRYNDLVSTEVQKTYNDIVYYVAEGGSDSKDGLTPENAKATVMNVFEAAVNRTFTAADRVVIYVSGTVVGTGGQSIDNYKALRANGKAVPVLITTYNYNTAQNNKAELKLTFNANQAGENARRLVCYNDITYQNLILKSYKDTTAGNEPIHRLHSAGQNVVLDNVTFATTGSNAWQVATDHFVTSGNNFLSATAANPIYSSVTFKNGDYTGLGLVSTVIKENIYFNNSSWTTEMKSKAPNVHCKIVVEDGAKMGTIYGQYSTLAVGSATVEINGGEVAQYIGTNSGTATAYKSYPVYATDYTPELNLVINGGVVRGVRGTGDYVKYTGNINTVMTGGKIEVHSTSAEENVYFGAGNQATINGDIINTISGGEVLVYQDSAKDCEIVFGGRVNCTINGNLVNKISGGTFAVLPGTGSGGMKGIFLGSYESAYTDTMRNEVTGGTFYCTGGAIFAGGHGLKSVYEKIENIIGTKDQPSKAPRFYQKAYLAGNWGQIGVTAYNNTAAGVPTACSDEVVLSNTIYGGYFASTVSVGVQSATNTGNNWYEFIKGSVENNIYGGIFNNHFFGSSYTGNTFGKVTNNIYGGKFSGIFAAGYGGTVHDGVETNIYAMEDLQICENNKPSTQTKSTFLFHAGNANGGTVKATTSGRPAAKLMFAPEKPEDITFYRTINIGVAVNGTKDVQIKGGYFPTNLNVSGVTVEDALAEGSYCMKDGAVVTPASGAGSVSGAVTVKPVAAMIGNAPYESLQAALKDAQGDEIVKLGADTEVETLSISSSKTLDLNGKKLIADNVLCFGDFIDSSDGKGSVVISCDTNEAVMHLQPGNPQLPIYDSENGCYRFFNYTPVSLGSKTVTEGTTEKFGFRIELTNAEGYDLLADAANGCVSLKAEVKVADRVSIPVAYSADLVKQYAEGAAAQIAAGDEVTKAFTLTVTGLGAVGAEETLVILPKVKTVSGMTIDLAPMTWQQTNQ